jgi:transcriptional regulator with XRE-family HTH domain
VGPQLNTFGTILRALRLERGLTLAQLAARVRKRNRRPITAAYLSQLENGRKPPPREPILIALEEGLGLTSGVLSEARLGRVLLPAHYLVKVAKFHRKPSHAAQAPLEISAMNVLIDRLQPKPGGPHPLLRLSDVRPMLRLLKEQLSCPFRLKLIVNEKGELEECNVIEAIE